MDAPKSSAPALAPEDLKARLSKLEDKYRHELIDPDERLEVREAIVRLRRKLS